ncbi:MAG: DEAD/DEAH box helicase [Geminicoccaceae bacterium]
MTIENSAPATFADLGLRDEVLRAVAEAGYSTPTPIQAAAIPHVLARRDVIGVAQTGTGKTASFTLPMLHILAAGRARARMPRSIILSPTRELATQTAANFEQYGKYLGLTMALIIGGVGMGDQEKLLDKGVDVLVATPGRLLDWFTRGKLMLTHVQIIVIDEADRMLDMGFIPDVEKIISLLVKREQTLLFSATMPPEVRRLADRFLSDPAIVEVARSASTNAAVDDFIVAVGDQPKRDALERLIRREGIGKAIIFSNRKREVASLARWLKRQGLNAQDIHGDLDQSQRQATLDAFKADRIDLLVATDVAARGLDIDDMPCVINFDIPIHAEDYVHRIGRTGRAGKSGRAFTFVGPEDGRYLSAIEKLIAKPIRKLGVAEKAAAAEEPAAGEDAAPAAPRDERPARREERRPPRQREARRDERAPARDRAPAPREGGRDRDREHLNRHGERRPYTEPRPAARLEPEVEAAMRSRGGRGERVERPEPDEALVFGQRADLPFFLTVPVPARLLAKSKDD